MQTTLPAGPRWYVISLRPRGAHAALRRAAQAAGHGFVALSPWRIVPRRDAAARDALAAAYAAGIAVFTSPAGVAAAKALVAPPLSLHAFAVGAGTAGALRRAGIAQVEHPRRMDSEGLLALPGLVNVAGRDVGFVTAPGGRGEIEPALRARGARVLRADVYAREAVAPSARSLARLHALDGRLALAVSSTEALRVALASLDDATQARLRGARVLAASLRTAEAASAAGFDDIVVAAGPRPAQLVAALDASLR